MFGESLFNDAVVIVLYNVVQQPGVTLLEGFVRFMRVFFVAMVVGAVIGFLTLIISRFTHKFRDAEPVVGIAMGYLSYVLAEFFGLSGIVSMTIYGLIYSEYINYNFKKKSNITIAKTIKTLAGISETMIFFLLGVVFFVIDYQWDTGFVFWSLAFIFLSRFTGSSLPLVCEHDSDSLSDRSCYRADFCRELVPTEQTHLFLQPNPRFLRWTARSHRFFLSPYVDISEEERHVRDDGNHYSTTTVARIHRSRLNYPLFLYQVMFIILFTVFAFG